MSNSPREDEEDINAPKAPVKQKVIIPPPEIKAVIDKTASYVAKNGVSFESLINKVEANNPKFNFLRYQDDPYRPYYIQKLQENQPEPKADEQLKEGSGSVEHDLKDT